MPLTKRMRFYARNTDLKWPVHPVQIKLSKSALSQLIVSATEAALIGDSLKTSRIKTCGYVWGERRRGAKHDTITVKLITPVIAAKRSYDEVEPHAQASSIHASVLGLLNPNLSLLGDFQSHPYKSPKRVFDIKGMEPSEGEIIDFKDKLSNQEEFTDWELMLIVTIAPYSNRKKHLKKKRFRPDLHLRALGQSVWVRGYVR